MNLIALFSLLLFIILRTLGLIVSIDLYLNTKNKSFLRSSIGWFLWIISAILPIFADLITDTLIIDLLLILNVFFALFGGILLFVSFIMYIIDLELKYELVLYIIPFTGAFIGFIFNNLQGTKNLLGYLLFAFYLSLIVIIYLNRQTLNQFFAKTSKYIYILVLTILSFFPLAILSALNNESYGFYNSTNDLLVMYNYLAGVGFTIIIMVIFTQFEYSISDNLKNDFKDNYSHDLGNIIQVINSATYLLGENMKSKGHDEENLKIIERNAGEAADLISKIRNL